MRTENPLETPFRHALSWPVARNSLVVALIVGTILNVINQGDVLWSGSQPDWIKALLTYCVPFCVATYGAYNAIRTLGAPSSSA